MEILSVKSTRITELTPVLLILETDPSTFKDPPPFILFWRNTTQWSFLTSSHIVLVFYHQEIIYANGQPFFVCSSYLNF